MRYSSSSFFGVQFPFLILVLVFTFNPADLLNERCFGWLEPHFFFAVCVNVYFVVVNRHGTIR